MVTIPSFLKPHVEIRTKVTKCKRCGKDIEISDLKEWNSTPLFCSVRCYNLFHRGMKYQCVVCGKKRAIMMGWLEDDPSQKDHVDMYRNYEGEYYIHYYDLVSLPPFFLCNPWRTKSDCLEQTILAMKDRELKIQRAIVRGAKKAGIIKKMPTSQTVIREISKIVMEHINGTHRS